MNKNSDLMFHEVKNALCLINAYVSLVELDKEKYITLLKKIIKDTTKLFNKLEIDKYFEDKADLINVNCLLDEVYTYFKPICKYQGINLILKKQQVKIHIYGSYKKMRHVLFNLIFNSIDAVNEIDNPTIIITFEIENNKVIIKCIDNGKGIDLTKLTSYNKKGIYNKGLGISIARNIIYEHGGTLLYESASNVYTKAYIKLDCKI